MVMKTLVNETSNSADHTTQYIFCGASFVAFDENVFGAGSFFSRLGSWDRINANIVHFLRKVLPKKCIFEFAMRPWDANIETCSPRSSFIGPLQNFW